MLPALLVGLCREMKAALLGSLRTMHAWLLPIISSL